MWHLNLDYSSVSAQVRSMSIVYCPLIWYNVLISDQDHLWDLSTRHILPPCKPRCPASLTANAIPPDAGCEGDLSPLCMSIPSCNSAKSRFKSWICSSTCAERACLNNRNSLHILVFWGPQAQKLRKGELGKQTSKFEVGCGHAFSQPSIKSERGRTGHSCFFFKSTWFCLLKVSCGKLAISNLDWVKEHKAKEHKAEACQQVLETQTSKVRASVANVQEEPNIKLYLWTSWSCLKMLEESSKFQIHESFGPGLSALVHRCPALNSLHLHSRNDALSQIGL